jgi:predicted DNA-binding transcriptional regulator AlpA
MGCVLSEIKRHNTMTTATNQATTRTRHAPGKPVEWASDIQLSQRYAVSRATIWRWAQDDDHPLPKPVKLGKNCTRWRLAQVVEALEGGI